MEETVLDESFRKLINRWIEPVNRYHLARRGDWQEAEILTTLSFLDAWLSSTTTPVGLFRLAAAHEASFRKVAFNHPGSQQAAYASSQPSQSFEENDRSEQETLLQRAQITGLGPYWSSLPAGQAGAVALVCFAGLDISQAGEVLCVSPERIGAWLESQAQVAANFTALAARTFLPIDFIHELEGALVQIPRPHRWQSWMARLQQQAGWRFFLLRPLVQKSPGLAPAFAIVLLLVFSVWTTLRMTSQPAAAPVQTTSTPADNLAINVAAATSTPAPDAAGIPAAGLLVPPSQSTCEGWQNTLENSLGAKASLALRSNFNDPAGNGPDNFGLGCFLTISTTRLQSLNDQTLTNQLLALLEKQGLMPVKQFPVIFYFNNQSTGGNPVRFLGDSAFHGQGFSLTHGEQRAVLELVSRAAPKSSPILPDLTLTPDDALAPHETEVVVYLGLASHAGRSALDTFISHWSAGNGQVIQDLSHSLRSQLDRLSALDNLVGIQREVGHRIQITWSVKENTGDRLRLEAWVEEVSQIALPGRRVGPFQLVLSQESGQWKVSALANGVIFSPSDDEMILVDSFGQIYKQSLSDGSRVNLSQPDFYDTKVANSTQAAPPSISPDGEWLYVTPPGSSTGWLISLDGMAHMQMEGLPTYLTWSPDHLQVAYVFADRPDQLFANWLGYLMVPRSIRLATAPGPIAALAWSPKGDQIAFAYTQYSPTPQISDSASGLTPVEPSDSQQPPSDPTYARPRTGSLVIVSLSLSTHLMQNLTSINWSNQATFSSQRTLQWTADESELWFPPGMISYHFLDRLPYRLIAEPENQFRPGLPNPPTQNLYVSSQPLALSPDKKWLAVTYFKINDSWPPKMAVLAMQTTDSPGKNQWTQLLPDIAAIDWTSEGTNLIVSEIAGGPGDLVRINPNTAEMQVILKNATYLGLVSTLQSVGNTQPLAASIARFDFPTFGSTWTTIPDPSLHMTLQVPAVWKTWQTTSDITALSSFLTVANFDFTSPVGFTSLERGDVYLTITRSSLASQPPSEWLASQTRNASLAVTNDVDGYPAFFRLSKDENLFSNTILFTTEDSGFTINWFSSNPIATGVIQDLLKSIQIMK